jgi:histidine triad (HIT) family protein
MADGGSDPDCVFCKIVAREIPADVVLEDERLIAIRDLHPAAPLHVLVMPKRHVPSAAEADRETMGLLSEAAQRVVRDAGQKDYRLVANVGAEAGQSVFHLHLHVLAGRPFSWPPG